MNIALIAVLVMALVVFFLGIIDNPPGKQARLICAGLFLLTLAFLIGGFVSK